MYGVFLAPLDYTFERFLPVSVTGMSRATMDWYAAKPQAPSLVRARLTRRKHGSCPSQQCPSINPFDASASLHPGFHKALLGESVHQAKHMLTMLKCYVSPTRYIPCFNETATAGD